MRLNRFLSQCGLGSRRGCEQIILEGRVTINGTTVTELGTVVAPEDSICVDGKPTRVETPIVIALNKPKGYICSRADERDRMTIYALLPRQLQTLHHVGRLDKESEGLLLMTNRGDLSHHLIHPSKGAEKEYEVVVDKPLDQATMGKLVHGMLTEEGHAKAERAWMITEYRCHMVLKQGLKRQIRLMLYQLGFEVERLVRTRIGWLELKGLPKGAWKQLTETEVQRFFTEAGTTGKPVSDDKPHKKPAAKKAGWEEEETPRRRPPVRRPTKGTGTKPTGRARYALPRPEITEAREPRRPRSGSPSRGSYGGRDESSERSSPPRRSGPPDRSAPNRRGYGGDREESSESSSPPRRSGPPDRSGPKRRGYGGDREDSPQRSGPPRRPRSDDSSFSERSGPPRRPSFGDRSGPRDRPSGPSDRSGPPRRSGPPGRSGPPSRGGPKKPGGKGPRNRP